MKQITTRIFLLLSAVLLVTPVYADLVPMPEYPENIWDLDVDPLEMRIYVNDIQPNVFNREDLVVEIRCNRDESNKAKNIQSDNGLIDHLQNLWQDGLFDQLHNFWQEAPDEDTKEEAKNEEKWSLRLMCLKDTRRIGCRKQVPLKDLTNLAVRPTCSAIVFLDGKAYEFDPDAYRKTNSFPTNYPHFEYRYYASTLINLYLGKANSSREMTDNELNQFNDGFKQLKEAANQQ